VAAEDPAHSYALYLPSDYSPERRWPIVYAFDPAARGRLPVSLLQAAAEELGYIVAGSHNARNGPTERLQQAADILWRDTHARFAIDDNRVYVAGFSGTARFASFLALRCNCTAGVIAFGAGLLTQNVPAPQAPFAFFAAVGELDFNYPEVMQLRPQLEQWNLPYRLVSFPGSHDWAPPDVWHEALAWMELQGMRSGRIERNPEFISQAYANGLEAARQLEAADPEAAYEEYVALARDFAGLADTSAAAEALPRLEANPELAQARRRRQEAFALQDKLTREFIATLLSFLRAPHQQEDLFAKLKAQATDLNARLNQPAPAPHLGVATRRAHSKAYLTAAELGQTRLDAGEPLLAVPCFELTAALFPTSPFPHFNQARAHAVAGNKTDALRALQRALSLGFSDRALLEQTPEFAPLRDDPLFKSLLARLPAQQ
jgi:dienelactone hydrolase